MPPHFRRSRLKSAGPQTSLNYWRLSFVSNQATQFVGKKTRRNKSHPYILQHFSGASMKILSTLTAILATALVLPAAQTPAPAPPVKTTVSHAGRLIAEPGKPATTNQSIVI